MGRDRCALWWPTAALVLTVTSAIWPAVFPWRGASSSRCKQRPVDGQIDELRGAIAANAEPPVHLIGHSWGAWLPSLLTARHPELVRKLILVGSAPFETSYVPQLTAIRAKRRAANRDTDTFAPIETEPQGMVAARLALRVKPAAMRPACVSGRRPPLGLTKMC